MQNRLLTPSLLAALSQYPLYSQESTPTPDQHAVTAFAIGNIRWYILEGNAEGDTFTFFGLVCGMSETPELGYINADELASIALNGENYGYPAGIVFRVEPIANFTPCKLSEIAETDVKTFCSKWHRSV